MISLPLKSTMKKLFRKSNLVFVLVEILLAIAVVKLHGHYESAPDYQKAIVCIGVLLIITVAWSYFALFYFCLSYHLIYLVLGLIMGLIFLILIPAYDVPDENRHFNTAYQLSNIMMGVKEEKNDRVLMRKADAEYKQISDYSKPSYMTVEEYQIYYSAFFKSSSNTNEIVRTQYSAIDTPYYQYFFPAVGITLGRIIGVGPIFLFFIGRLFNMLFSVLLISYAIKKTPIGKVGFFVSAMFPMLIQQLSSFSYDAFVISISFVVFALSLYMSHTDINEIKWYEEILYIILCILLAFVKSHAYILISLVSFYVFLKQHKNNKFKAILPFLSVILTVVICEFYIKLNNSGTMISDNPFYTMHDVISDPHLFIMLIYNTVISYFGIYLDNMIGSSLGIFSIEVPTIFIRLLLIIGVVAFFKRSDDTVELSRQERILYLFVILFTVIFMHAGMLLGWTPKGSIRIEGVQGRYFLPILPAAIYSVQTQRITVSKKVDPYLIMSEILLVSLSVITILKRF